MMSTVTSTYFFGQAPGSATDHFRAGSRNFSFEKHKVKVLTVAQCAYILT